MFVSQCVCGWKAGGRGGGGGGGLKKKVIVFVCGICPCFCGVCHSSWILFCFAYGVSMKQFDVLVIHKCVQLCLLSVCLLG